MRSCRGCIHAHDTGCVDFKWMCDRDQGLEVMYYIRRNTAHPECPLDNTMLDDADRLDALEARVTALETTCATIALLKKGSDDNDEI